MPYKQVRNKTSHNCAKIIEASDGSCNNNDSWYT